MTVHRCFTVRLLHLNFQQAAVSCYSAYVYTKATVMVSVLSIYFSIKFNSERTCRLVRKDLFDFMKVEGSSWLYRFSNSRLSPAGKARILFYSYFSSCTSCLKFFIERSVNDNSSSVASRVLHELLLAWTRMCRTYFRLMSRLALRKYSIDIRFTSGRSFFVVNRSQSLIVPTRSRRSLVLDQ